MPPKKSIGKVEYKQNLASNIWIVRISLDGVMDFIPGQYISLKVSDEGVRRSYSVASLPGEKYLDLLVDVTPMGVGSKYILSLEVGDFVELLGFLGRFTLDLQLLKESSQILFVATGTGIAPFLPMIEDLLKNKEYKGRISLVWGMRYEKDLYWLKEIKDMCRDYDNLNFELVLSKPGDEWLGRRGYVGGVIEGMELEAKTTVAYLCGSPKMIDDINNLLIKKEVSEDNIFFERYF